MKNKFFFSNKKVVAIIATFCCLLWGSAYPAIKNGYILFNISPDDIPSKLVFAGYRFFIAGLVLLVIAQIYGKKILHISRKSIQNVFLLGIIQTTVHYIFFYVGVANTTGVKSSIMNSTVAFFSVILAHYIYKNDKL
ncbi:DMT family transporter, partial [Clostridium sp.]|uniref:DMT family transporter n=1 Tax=Clostridium sp. TaxID=1506 RepID=UPI001A5372F2